VAVISCLAVLGCAAQPHGHKAAWSYSGKNGPAQWGELRPQFIMAGIGQNQSPINIGGPTVVEAGLPAIKFNYKQVPLAVLNNGHTIQAVYAEGSSIDIDGVRFGLKQFHFHSPGEHRIRGVSYPLEAHLVHADKDGNLAVIALMFVEGRENDFIAKVWASAPEEEGKTHASTGETINVMHLLPTSKDYYRYNGSLTTPPCSEGVRWLVLKRPVELSKEQVRTFQRLIGFANNRPVQATNARLIVK
jgi:carbonic anhydrase